jgi:hypothetical protein
LIERICKYLLCTPNKICSYFASINFYARIGCGSSCAGSRVTRLGQFSPIERLFTLCSLLKFSKVALIFGLLFYTIKVTHLFRPTMGGATFWAFFFHKLIRSPWLGVSFSLAKIFVESKWSSLKCFFVSTQHTRF